MRDGEGSLAGDVLRVSAKSQDGLWPRQSTRGGGEVSMVTTRKGSHPTPCLKLSFVLVRDYFSISQAR